MLVLGIDPGTAICGFGLVEHKNSSLRAIDYGVITTEPSLALKDRLHIIHTRISELLETYRPAIMGVEQLFFNKNVTTAMSVGQARGVILLAAAQHQVQLAEYTPLQVKQSVVGYGKATKEQMIFMTQRLLNLPQKPHPDDAADALAIAICTTHSAGSKAQFWGASL